MPKRGIGKNVFDAAIDRMVALYEAGHRVVVSFSAGKDSGACLEVCIIAAKLTGRLPVDVVMRDEEIMYPGTFEYAERVAARTDEVSFHWLIANQPIVNVFNRKAPYFWTFDPMLPPEKWVRQPPKIAYVIQDKCIAAMNTPERFPAAEGKELFSVIGLRVQESMTRTFAIHSSGGYLTKPQPPNGVRNCRPIYDWTDGDVWKAVHDNKWDYNHAYDTMHRMGVPRTRLRIAPPTLNQAAIGQLQVAARAWPRWFSKCCERLEGLRSAAQFGRRACEPMRRLSETWEACFRRTCIEEAPAPWIAERAKVVMAYYLNQHKGHSTTPFPEISGCRHCTGGKSMAAWKKLAHVLYNGDPFALKTNHSGLVPIEPEFFRPGSGTWGGKPTW